ncbi:MAG: basic amino acid ABC transporter substrate-binding protein [Rubrobacter sp.]|nr:basic amino acid ABC transporter substrate-binding protein [Rubrobacter sp.]
MRRSRTLALIALAVTMLMTLAACGGGGENNGEGGGEENTSGGGSTTGGASGGETITVASDIAYRPFEFSENGEAKGFDIDLMNEIGERAGFGVKYQNVAFDGIIGGLGSNLYDASISSMTITPEREEQIDFSDPYFNADQSLLVTADSDIQAVEDIGDATVGVQIGTTGEIKANEFAESGEITGDVRTFDTIEDAFAALENQQVDAIINDLPVSQDKANKSDGNLKIVQTIPTGEQYGIAFPTDSELVGPVNDALAEIKDDGTYAKIYEKWIGREPEEIP